MTTLRLGPFDRHGTARARVDGRFVEIEHGIPGELVEAEIARGQRPRGRIVRILEASPDRVTPPCPYFTEWHCGGCQWQMLSYEAQLRFKREAVERAMRAEGLDLPVAAVHHLDDPWRYRSTAGIALGKRAGFRRHASLAIVPIRDCPISHPLIGKLMAHLNDALESSDLPDFHGRVRVEVRVTDGVEGERLEVMVRPTENARPPSSQDMDALLAMLRAFPEMAGVSIAHQDDQPATVAGQAFGVTTVMGRPVSVAAGSFFQTNLRLLPKLIARLRQEAEPLSGRRVADVYAGVGIFGLFLADEAEEVTIVESDPIAIEAAKRTAELWDLRNVQFVAAQAEEALQEACEFDVLLVDPPRSGLNETVREAIARFQPPTVLYVSCLPQSLARDLVDLTGAGYGVESLELFDFYPQTYHVELLAVLRGSGA